MTVQDLIDLHEIEMQQRVRMEVPVKTQVRAEKEMVDKLKDIHRETGVALHLDVRPPYTLDSQLY